MDNLLGLFLLFLALWYWLDGLRARERAIAVGRAACEERGLQFLDQAVALRSIAVRWTPAGLRLRRVYRFEFSEGGFARDSGHLVLVGLRVEEVSMGLPSGGLDA